MLCARCNFPCRNKKCSATKCVCSRVPSDSIIFAGLIVYYLLLLFFSCNAIANLVGYFIHSSFRHYQVLQYVYIEMRSYMYSISSIDVDYQPKNHFPNYEWKNMFHTQYIRYQENRRKEIEQWQTYSKPIKIEKSHENILAEYVELSFFLSQATSCERGIKDLFFFIFS